MNAFLGSHPWLLLIFFPKLRNSRNPEYQGYIYHYENRSPEIFRIYGREQNRKPDETFFFFLNISFQQLLESERLRL